MPGSRLKPKAGAAPKTNLACVLSSKRAFAPRSKQNCARKSSSVRGFRKKRKRKRDSGKGPTKLVRPNGFTAKSLSSKLLVFRNTLQTPGQFHQQATTRRMAAL